MGVGQGNSFEGAVKPDSITVDGYEPNVFAHRFTQIETNQQGFWDYAGTNNVVYAGYAPTGLPQDGDENGNGFLLHKFSYDTNGNVISRQIAYGNWTNHTSYVYS